MPSRLVRPRESSATVSSEVFPKISYLGPAIRSGLGGPALMFKLLSSYPHDRLMLVQTHSSEVIGEQLRAARIINLPCAPRWIGIKGRTFFDMSFGIARRAWSIPLCRRIEQFAPDAMVCVLHGWAAEVASILSSTLRIPFHLVIHDAPNVTLPAPRMFDEFRKERWECLCRRATSRLCVSPGMASEVQKKTGVPASVIYPSLAPRAHIHRAPARDRKPLTFAFAGHIHHGYSELLLRLANELAQLNHQLVLHSPQSETFIAQFAPPATIDGGWVGGDKLASTLAEEADVLFLPMSFQRQDQHNTRVSFPSKLAEYCAAGKPILVWAPAYASPVEWLREHPGFSAIVTSQHEQELRKAISHLQHTEARNLMGQRAADAANQLFSHAAVFAAFRRAIGADCAT